LNVKKTATLFLGILAVTLFWASVIKPATAAMTLYENIYIHSDGSVTPSDAPVTRNGDTYVFNDSVIMYRDYYDGITVEKDNIVLDGAGHKLQGLGGSEAIHMEDRVNVTIKNFLLEAFYYGLAFWNCSQCIVSENNLTADMYCIYLQSSSGNQFYHNDIVSDIYFQNSSNSWDNGYPSGGNHWNGYPYADVKSGPNQNLPGSDGIGDTPVDLSIFVSETNDTDHYPLMTPPVIPEYQPILIMLLATTATLLSITVYRRKTHVVQTHEDNRLPNQLVSGQGNHNTDCTLDK
jgi:parallel beta-helix repeat protein